MSLYHLSESNTDHTLTMSLEFSADIAAPNAAVIGGVIGQKTSVMPNVIMGLSTPAMPVQNAASGSAAAPAAPAVPVQTADSVGITLTTEQWSDYTKAQARIAELEEIERRRGAEAQAAEIKALQAKGQIEQAFNLQREQARLQLDAERKKLKETEERAKRYALDGELARALGGATAGSGWYGAAHGALAVQIRG